MKKELSYSRFIAMLEAGESVTTPNGACPVGVALDVFRGRWKADVLYRLCAGPAGFGDLQRRFKGIARAMLSATLRDLAAIGVVSRREITDGKIKRTEYALTPRGKELYPVFYALMKWGWKHSQTKGTTK